MNTKKHMNLFYERRDLVGFHNVDAINVNKVHRDAMSLNDKIAMWVSNHVGTMWFCYGLALLMIVWALSQAVLLPRLGIKPFDPYSFPFLFFILGGVMQSLLMPLIMVAQNQGAKHSELRAESDHHITQESFARLEQIMHHLDGLGEEALHQTELIQQQDANLTQLLSKPATTRKKVEAK